MSFTTITDEELVGLGVTGLDDTPELSTEAMQAQFDEYPQFLKDKFKTHISEAEANTASGNIGATIPGSLQDEVETEKIQPILDELAVRVKNQKDWQDAADQNFSPAEINTAVFHADSEEVTVPTVDTSDVSNKAASTEFVNAKMQAIGAGDMAKSVYDPNDRGVVEKAYDVTDSVVTSIEDSIENYPEPAANDPIKTIVGKIKKYLSDLKNTLATDEHNGMMSSTDKEKLDNITPLAQSAAVGTCSTAATTAEKEITLSDNNWKLRAGAIIGVVFSNTNTAQNPTFNVNSKGAKSVFFDNAVISTSMLSMAGTASRPMYYQYDGTNWVFVGWSIDVASHASSETKYGVGTNSSYGHIKLSDSLTSTNSTSNGTAATPNAVKLVASMVRNSSSDAYSTSKAYSVGEHVIRDNKVYKCKTACSAGSWSANSTNFEETSLTAAVSDLNASLTDSGWMNYNTIKGDKVQYRKYGKFVEIRAHEVGDSITTSYTNWIIMPEGYRPSITVVSKDIACNNTTTAAIAKVKPDGYVQVAAASADTLFSFHIIYTVD